MRQAPNLKIEHYRVLSSVDRRFGTTTQDGNNGLFIIPSPFGSEDLQVICSDGQGWDHVSVSLRKRCPTWGEMDYIKRLFFEDEETAMQLHPPRSMWISNHPYCLHLWRPTGIDANIPMPDLSLVGFLGVEGVTDDRGRVAGLKRVSRS